MYASQVHGGEHWREYLDITPDYYALAAIVNAINDNTRATGHWKKAPPAIPPYPVPSLAVKHLEKRKLDKPKTVKDLFARMQGMTASLPGAKAL